MVLAVGLLAVLALRESSVGEMSDVEVSVTELVSNVVASDAL